MRAIDKLERHTVIAGTLKQELLKRQYVVFGSECVNITTINTTTITTTSTVNKFQNIGITYVSHGTSIPPYSSWLPHNLATLPQPSETGIAHECIIGHLTSQSFDQL